MFSLRPHFLRLAAPRRLWAQVSLERRILGWSAAAVIMTVLTDTVLPPGLAGSRNESGDGAITILTTVIGFLAVATLVISLSTSLVEAVQSRYGRPEIVQIVVEDEERDDIMRLIIGAFLISLVQLCLLNTGLLRPTVAIALPVVLSALTIMALGGYVSSRIRMFDAANMIRLLSAKLRRQSETAFAANHSSQREERAEIIRTMVQLTIMCETEITQSRFYLDETLFAEALKAMLTTVQSRLDERRRGDRASMVVDVEIAMAESYGRIFEAAMQEAAADGSTAFLVGARFEAWVDFIIEALQADDYAVAHMSLQPMRRLAGLPWFSQLSTSAEIYLKLVASVDLLPSLTRSTMAPPPQHYPARIWRLGEDMISGENNPLRLILASLLARPLVGLEPLVARVRAVAAEHSIFATQLARIEAETLNS